MFLLPFRGLLHPHDSGFQGTTIYCTKMSEFVAIWARHTLPKLKEHLVCCETQSDHQKMWVTWWGLLLFCLQVRETCRAILPLWKFGIARCKSCRDTEEIANSFCDFAIWICGGKGIWIAQFKSVCRDVSDSTTTSEGFTSFSHTIALGLKVTARVHLKNEKWFFVPTLFETITAGWSGHVHVSFFVSKNLWKYNRHTLPHHECKYVDQKWQK